MLKNEELVFCSFCGKEQDEVDKIIAGPGVFICDECVDLCNTIIIDDDEKESTHKKGSLRRPKDIKAFLDEYIIGQNSPKVALSVAVYNHYKRLEYVKRQKQIGSTKQKNNKYEIELDKSNILLLGPTGSGKTLLAQTLARIIDVPLALVDATALTEAGYVGEDVENILLRLYQNANEDVEQTEIGIIYIDEIDKVARKSDNPSITRDVSGEGVQQALLKIIEGTLASVPPMGGRKHPHQEFLEIDTKNILFILGGAFEGLEEIIKKRVDTTSLGFDYNSNSKIKKDSDYYLSQVTHEDLMKYGLIPEFVGRLPIVRTLNPLDQEALVRILQEPKNALTKQYAKMFEMEGVKLTFTDESIKEVAALGLKKEIGARGLKTILEEVMTELMYEIPSMKGVEEVIITKEVFTKKSEPEIVYFSEKGKKSTTKKNAKKTSTDMFIKKASKRA